MNTLVWVAQVALASSFMAHGLLFLFPPPAVRKLKKGISLPAPFIGFVYAAETLGALGLVVPALTGVLPWLTPLAAVGLAPIAGGAVVFHLSRREAAPVLVTVVLLALAVLVACVRWFVIPL